MNTNKIIDYLCCICPQHPLGMEDLWSCSKEVYNQFIKDELYSKLQLKTGLVKLEPSPTVGKFVTITYNTGASEDQIEAIVASEWKDYCNSVIKNDLVSFYIQVNGENSLTIRESARFLKALLHVMIDSPSVNKGKGFFGRFCTEDIIEPFSRMCKWTVVDFVSIAKYISVYPLAASAYVDVDQELPPIPQLSDGTFYSESPVLWSGKIKKFIMNRVNSAPRGSKNLQFMWSWQRAKAGCEVVPPEFIQSAVTKHKKSLSSPFVRGPFEGFFGAVPVNFQRKFEEQTLVNYEERLYGGEEALVRWSSRLIVDALFPKREEPHPIRLYEASSSASYEKKRSEGGQRAVIREVGEASSFHTYLEKILWCPRYPKGREVRSDLECGSRELIHRLKMSLDFLYYQDIFRKRVVRTFQRMRPRSEEDPIFGESFGLSLLEGEGSEGREVRKDDWIEWKTGLRYPREEVDYGRKLKATVATVLEPLKVRTLTKEESIPQYLCKDLQKQMWEGLRKVPVFKLIGQPVGPEDIHDLIRRSGERGEDWTFLVSGDYSAATDGVDPERSLYLLERIMKNLNIDEDVKHCARKNLGMHRIEYSKSMGLEPFDQVKGQLMGGILSFPILCLMNLLTYLTSTINGMGCLLKMENQPKKAKILLERLTVLINGDDILFPCKRFEYEMWSRNLSHFGFSKSLGKNLISSKFCTINSECFKVGVTSQGEIEVEKVLCLNLGLLECRSKVNQSGSKDAPLWDIFNQMIDGASQKDHARAYFNIYNKKQINEMTSNGRFNLYLPRSLGGCGFKGEAKFYTDFQIRLASYLYRRHKRCGDLVEEDLGLISKSCDRSMVVLDNWAEKKGCRVKKFDVPRENWYVKRAPLVGKPMNGSFETEVTLNRRNPIPLPEGFDSRPVNIEKLREFSDNLKIILM